MVLASLTAVILDELPTFVVSFHVLVFKRITGRHSEKTVRGKPAPPLGGLQSINTLETFLSTC